MTTLSRKSNYTQTQAASELGHKDIQIECKRLRLRANTRTDAMRSCLVQHIRAFGTLAPPPVGAPTDSSSPAPAALASGGGGEATAENQNTSTNDSALNTVAAASAAAAPAAVVATAPALATAVAMAPAPTLAAQSASAAPAPSSSLAAAAPSAAAPAAAAAAAPAPNVAPAPTPTTASRSASAAAESGFTGPAGSGFDGDSGDGAAAAGGAKQKRKNHTHNDMARLVHVMAMNECQSYLGQLMQGPSRMSMDDKQRPHPWDELVTVWKNKAHVFDNPALDTEGQDVSSPTHRVASGNNSRPRVDISDINPNASAIFETERDGDDLKKWWADLKKDCTACFSRWAHKTGENEPCVYKRSITSYMPCPDGGTAESEYGERNPPGKKLQLEKLVKYTHLCWKGRSELLGFADRVVTSGGQEGGVTDGPSHRAKRQKLEGASGGVSPTLTDDGLAAAFGTSDPAMERQAAAVEKQADAAMLSALLPTYSAPGLDAATKKAIAEAIRKYCPSLVLPEVEVPGTTPTAATAQTGTATGAAAAAAPAAPPAAQSRQPQAQ